MKNWLIMSLILVGIVLISGCVGQEQPSLSDEDRAKSLCIDECNRRLNIGEDLSNGPCLLNPLTDLPSWVCDVAHKPRQPVDDRPENQCSAYREGRATHFVEVDPTCKFIKAI